MAAKVGSSLHQDDQHRYSVQEPEPEQSGHTHPEVKQLQNSFSSLLSSTVQSLEQQGMKPKQVTDYLSACHLKLSAGAQTNSIGDIFDILFVDCSFLDYLLLEAIITELGSDNDKSSFVSYKANVQSFLDTFATDKQASVTLCERRPNSFLCRVSIEEGCLSQYHSIKHDVARILGAEVKRISTHILEHNCVQFWLSAQKNQQDRNFKFDASIVSSAILEVVLIRPGDKPITMFKTHAGTKSFRNMLAVDSRSGSSLSIPLVQRSKTSQALVFNDDALKLLRTIQKPVAVLGICGPYRTGKSYFLSKVLGPNSEHFRVSNSTDPCTKGIWMATQFVELEHCTVVLLDTEGIGAVQANEASSKEEVMNYLVLTTLLSSYLIYNVKGAITESHLNEMSLFGELSNSLRVSGSHIDDTHENCLRNHFPDFLWLLRDGDLIDGGGLSATEYIQKKILVTANTGNKPPSSRDKTIKSIQTIFPKIECLKITSPGVGLSNPEKAHLVDPEFFVQLESVRRHILKNIRIKKGFDGAALDGAMLASLLEVYVETINDPRTARPNLEANYWQAIELTLHKAISDLADGYYMQMSSLLDQHYPLEEGDPKASECLQSSKVEKCSLAVLEADDVPSSLSETATLFEVHNAVFSYQLSKLSIQLHKLIPVTPTADKQTQDDVKARRMQHLKQFSRTILLWKDGCITEGRFTIFQRENITKSTSACKEIFEQLYKQQTCYGELSVSLEALQMNYYKEAKGPEKDKVFQSLFPEIPGPPQQLVVKPIAETSIILSWQKPAMHCDSVTNYDVQWYMENDSPQESTVPASDRQYKIHRLKPKTTYYLKVRGKNTLHSRLGSYSELIKYETIAAKPDAPDSPTVTAESDTKVRLTVNMLPKRRENGSPVKWIVVNSTAISDKGESKPVETIYPLDPELEEYHMQPCDIFIPISCQSNETSLRFKVQFENSAGRSDPSASVELKVEDMIPGIPENIRAISKARQIELKWELPKINPRAVKSYSIQYWQKKTSSESGNSRTDIEVGHLDNSKVIENLIPNQEYSIRIYARSAIYRFCLFSTVDVRTRPDVPNMPQTPTIRVLSATKAILTFYRQSKDEENGSPLEYVIVEHQSKGVTADQATWTEVKKYQIPSNQDKTTSIDLQVDLKSLTEKNISYCYRIKTENSVGESKPSQAVEIRPEQIIPGEPQDLRATSAESNCVVLSWKKPDINPVSVKGYQIQYKSHKDTTWTSKLKADPDIHTTTISDLKPHTEYSFRVQALNGSLSSNEAELKSLYTLSSVPPKPRPPVPIAKGSEFIVKVYIPPVGESGSEATRVYIQSYKNVDGASFKLEEFTVKNITKKGNDRYIEQRMQINVDKTKWISVKLRNEVGISEESDVVGISSGDVCPGKPHQLTFNEGSRHVQLSWYLPEENGTAAKNYEVFKKEGAGTQWTQIEKCSIHQNRSDDTLYYSTTIEGLAPFTLYQFGVQAVNNTNNEPLVGKRVTIEVQTKKAVPEKPKSPGDLELIENEPLKAKITVTSLPVEKMNGSTVKEVIVECIDHFCMAFPLSEDEQKAEQIKRKIDIPNIHNPNIRSHWFQIQMKNEVGLSEPSEPYPMSIEKIKPGPPQNLQVTSKTAHTITVMWQKPLIHPALVKQYTLTVLLNEVHVHTQSFLETNAESHEYTIIALKSNQKYDISIVAVGTQQNSIPVEQSESTTEVYAGAPAHLYIDKIGNNSVKIRWLKPTEQPNEVEFYLVELMRGELSDPTSHVVKARRSKGDSTVFENLECYTIYTIIVSSYNDNKKMGEHSYKFVEFYTKMSKAAKRLWQIVTGPTIALPVALGYSQAPDENIYESDDEYECDPNVYPSHPEKLEVKCLGFSDSQPVFNIVWKPPIHYAEELCYYRLQIVEHKRDKEIIREDTRLYNPNTIANRTTESLYRDFKHNVEYTVSITSYNYLGEANDQSTVKLTAKFYDEKCRADFLLHELKHGIL